MLLFQIILNSMHKFQPRIHLINLGRGVPGIRRGHHSLDIANAENRKTFAFAETAFTAVTAYQNQLVKYGHCLLHFYR